MASGKRIIEGLEDALAYVQGDTSRARKALADYDQNGGQTLSKLKDELGLPDTTAKPSLLDELALIVCERHCASACDVCKRRADAVARVMLERQQRDLHNSLKAAGYHEDAWREKNIAQTWSMRWLKLWAREHCLEGTMNAEDLTPEEKRAIDCVMLHGTTTQGALIRAVTQAIRDAVADEREACAVLASGMLTRPWSEKQLDELADKLSAHGLAGYAKERSANEMSEDITKAIRARKP